MNLQRHMFSVTPKYFLVIFALVKISLSLQFFYLISYVILKENYFGQITRFVWMAWLGVVSRHTQVYF